MDKLPSTFIASFFRESTEHKAGITKGHGFFATCANVLIANDKILIKTFLQALPL